MTVSPEQTVVGFIGTGVMGCPMAGHLLDAGYAVHVYNRTREKAKPLLDKGATWHDGPAGVAGESDVVITIVGYPDDVRQVHFGPDGLIDNARPGTVLIDMTTSDPSLAQEIAEACREHDLQELDAPVSGGDRGAREGTLSIMVGGDKETFQRCLPLLEVLGKNIVYQGPAGSGQHTKMANQIAIAAGMLGVCEAILYARASGLDPETVLESISGGASGSWSLSNLGPRMIEDDWAPGFYIKHFIKDMSIARKEADDHDLATPGLELALRLYRDYAEAGGGDEGTQALYRLLEKRSGG